MPGEPKRTAEGKPERKPEGKPIREKIGKRTGLFILALLAASVLCGARADAPAAWESAAVLPEGLAGIGEEAFAGCGLEAVYLPDGLESLAEDAFDGGVGIYAGADCGIIPYLDAWGREYAVPRLPDSLSLSPASARIAPGGTVSLRAVFSPADADVPPLRWTSSDEAVAEVSSDGTVTGLAEGSAVIRAEAPGGLAAETTVAVHGTVCRALLVANVEYGGESCGWNAGDMVMLWNMLSSVNGPNGKPWQVTVLYDLNADKLEKALKSVFAHTAEGDISLFHISSHGDVNATGKMAGRLKMAYGREAGEMTFVPYGTLKEWTDRYIRGDKVLFLEACSSGSAIDPRAGAAFRDAGYYVLTSSGYMESCWSNHGDHNYFVQWLTAGVGPSGAMPADSNRDGALTVGELYAYISRVGDGFPIGTGPAFVYQHAHAYPEKSDFVLFLRE